MFRNSLYNRLFISTIILLFAALYKLVVQLDAWLPSNEIANRTLKTSLRFHEFLTERWTDEFHWKMSFFENDLDTSSFTNKIAHCSAVCMSNNTHYGTISIDGNCRTVPVLIFDANNSLPEQAKATLAESTLPCLLKLENSRIPGAGEGIFTRFLLPWGVIFGPYEGEILSDYGEEGLLSRRRGYSWKIFRIDENGDEDNVNIDGSNVNSSNWLRWVNCARYEEEQNMIALQFNSTVYYMTYKNIPAGSELLVWYGYGYARYLNIFARKDSGYDTDGNFAPTLDSTVCFSCPRNSSSWPKDDLITEEEQNDNSLINNVDDMPIDFDSFDEQ